MSLIRFSSSLTLLYVGIILLIAKNLLNKKYITIKSNKIKIEFFFEVNSLCSKIYKY